MSKIVKPLVVNRVTEQKKYMWTYTQVYVIDVMMGYSYPVWRRGKMWVREYNTNKMFQKFQKRESDTDEEVKFNLTAKTQQ